VTEPAPQRKLRYEIVKEMILKMIEDQNLQAGSRLPTSIELVELSGFSLISVRRALDELERAGRDDVNFKTKLASIKIGMRARLALSPREQVVRIRGVRMTKNGMSFDYFQQIYQSRQFVFFVSGTHNRDRLPTTKNNRWGVAPLPGF
jgi:DNA-binding GntR family transcriptional regulator